MAGLVLGGFPLLLSAVEHYRDCFEVLGCWTEFRVEYRKCKNRIRQLELEYDQTLDKLYFPVVDSEEELERLKVMEKEEEWAAVEEKLQQRLHPKVFLVYKDTMSDLSEAMEDLKRELGYGVQSVQDRIGKVSTGAIKRSEYSSEVNTEQKNQKGNDGKEILSRLKGKMSYEAQRMKFSVGKRPRAELFHQIETLIKRLGTILTQNDEIAALRSGSAQKPTYATQGALLQFWQHAHNVYSLLSKSWQCICRTDHSADLLLEHRTKPDIQLDVVLLFSHSSKAQQWTPWVCHATRIKRMGASVIDTSPYSNTPTYEKDAMCPPAPFAIASARRRSTELATSENVTSS